MGFTVKTIRDRKYVYEVARVGGRKITRYIGPLDAIVLSHLARERGLNVNPKLARRELRRLARLLAEEVVNSLGKGSDATKNLWARGDLNPRPPGYQPGAPPG